MPRTQTEVERLLSEAHAEIAIGNHGAALLLLHRAEALAPQPAGWRAIGDAWHAAGNHSAGASAHLRAARASARDPELVAAGEAMASGQLDAAEAALRARLEAQPTDIAAMRMMAELEVRLGHYPQAAALLELALGLAPGYEQAQEDLGRRRLRQPDP